MFRKNKRGSIEVSDSDNGDFIFGGDASKNTAYTNAIGGAASMNIAYLNKGVNVSKNSSSLFIGFGDASVKIGDEAGKNTVCVTEPDRKVTNLDKTPVPEKKAAVLGFGKHSNNRILEAIKMQLHKMVMKEFNEYGKATKVFDKGQFAAAKKQGIHQEVQIDSSLYNKELLLRSQNIEQNEQDKRDTIKRSFDREGKKQNVRLTHAQKEAIKYHFTSKELWETIKPVGFKGDKVDYLMFLRNEKKEKKLLEQKKLKQMDLQAKNHRRNKTMKEVTIQDVGLSEISIASSSQASKLSKIGAKK